MGSLFTPSRPVTLQDLIDRAVIGDTLLNYATGVDRRDWALYRSIFADAVEIDFETWSGQSAGVMQADDWVASVRETLACFDATAHTMTNHVIRLAGDSATIVSHMVALHYFEGEIQELGGFYADRLVRDGGGWKIVGCRLVIKWERGSRTLFERARARGPRPRIDIGIEGM